MLLISGIVSKSNIRVGIKIYLGNIPVERYLSPRSQAIETICEFGFCLAICIATKSAPPVEAPEKIPSFFASFLAVSSAFFCETFTISSILSSEKIEGKYSFGHFLIPGICAPSSG